jgi:hypothetical protein
MWTLFFYYTSNVNNIVTGMLQLLSHKWVYTCSILYKKKWVSKPLFFNLRFHSVKEKVPHYSISRTMWLNDVISSRLILAFFFCCLSGTKVKKDWGHTGYCDWNNNNNKKTRELCKDEINRLSRHYTRKVGKSLKTLQRKRSSWWRMD